MNETLKRQQHLNLSLSSVTALQSRIKAGCDPSLQSGIIMFNYKHLIISSIICLLESQESDLASQTERRWHAVA